MFGLTNDVVTDQATFPPVAKTTPIWIRGVQGATGTSYPVYVYFTPPAGTLWRANVGAVGTTDTPTDNTFTVYYYTSS
jgi:hypothetical protein